jgi:uncharacterized membrane protein
MEKKYKFLLVIGTLTISYIFMLAYFYIDYSNSLKEVNTDTYESFNTLQNVIHKVHNEDSILYKTLLSKEILNTNTLKGRFQTFHTNQSTDVIGDLLDLKENKYFSSQSLASTIDEYYSLENLRSRIIELHKQNLLNSNVNYDKEISNLLEEYETQTSIILIDMNKEIELSKENSLLKQENLLSNFIKIEFISLIYYIFSIIIILYFFKFHEEFKSKEEEKVEDRQILDEDMRRIISYIKKEVGQGHFPTIKELKFYLKISHPTLIIKLNKLEKSNMIAIKKEGRNKHLFLK